MKKQLLKKFSAFIFIAMLFSASANAQIVYTDINPDTTIIRTRLNQRGIVSIAQNMDLNNDGIPDLKFTLISSIITGFPPQWYGYTAGTILATPLNGSAILMDSSGYPAKMNLNDIISANANWDTIANQIIFKKLLSNGTTTNTGNWNTATGGFLGLRVIAGGQTHYCWIQMNAAAFVSGSIAATLTLMDYAYNSIPNQAILAGETIATGINENSFASSINLFPNPANDYFTITLGSSKKNVEVAIADITGKIIPIAIGNTTTANETNKIEMNTGEFAEGIYIVKIQSGESIATKKLIIKK